MIFLTNNDILNLAENVANNIQNNFIGQSDILLYGIPRGGIPAVYAVKSFLPAEYKITDILEEAHIIIDDIIDSGTTKNKALAQNPTAQFFALIDKELDLNDNNWYVFPWEATVESSIEDAYIRLKQFYNVADDEFEKIKTSINKLFEFS